MLEFELDLIDRRAPDVKSDSSRTITERRDSFDSDYERMVSPKTQPVTNSMYNTAKIVYIKEEVKAYTQVVEDKVMEEPQSECQS